MSRSIIFSLSLLSIISAQAMDSGKFEQINKIKKMASLPIFSPGQDGVKIFHDGKVFFVKEKHQAPKQIHNYDVDPLLQKMTSEQLDTFQKTAGFLVAKRLSNGEYKLNANVRVLGGGPVGANIGFWIGAGLVYGVGHGAIFVVCRAADMIAPGSGATVQVKLHEVAQPVIHGVAGKVGLAAGIFVGASTPI